VTKETHHLTQSHEMTENNRDLDEEVDVYTTKTFGKLRPNIIYAMILSLFGRIMKNILNVASTWQL
jgi:hypothetical protein